MPRSQEKAGTGKEVLQNLRTSLRVKRALIPANRPNVNTVLRSDSENNSTSTLAINSCALFTRRSKRLLELAAEKSEDSEKRKRDERISCNDPSLTNRHPNKAGTVFGIDLIMKTILQKTPHTEWVKYRLVNRQWNTIATRLLRRHNRFHMHHPGFIPKTDQTTPLLDFTRFIRNSSARNMFPFNRFVIYATSIGNRLLQNFVNLQGDHIEELIIASRDFKGKCTTETALKKLHHLLVNQVPNIKHLELTIKFQEKEEHESYLPMQASNPNYLRITNLVDQSEKRNMNLKAVVFGEQTLTDVIELVCQSAPNLNKIQVRQEQYCCLIEPTNRINLLFALGIFEGILNVPQLKRITAAIQEKEGVRLPLELAIFQAKVYPSANEPNYSQLRKELCLLMRTVFENCYPTLDFLRICDAYLLENVWPQCMPNCQALVLHFVKYNERNEFNFLKIFPNLKFIRLIFGPNDAHRVAKFISACKYGPMKRVTEIEIAVRQGNNFINIEESSFVDLLKQISVLKDFFPKATIKSAKLIS